MTKKVDQKSAPAGAGKMLEEALKYHDLGYSVIPIHTIIKGKCSCKKHKCSAPGKHARVDWKKHQNQRADEKQIRMWWENWPKANIGIVTGKVSGITVLDIDGEEGIKSLEEAGYKVEDFNTPTVKTGGGGYHLYFKNNESIKSKGGVLKKVDVKSESGLVVAPPSFHASGNNYQWLKKPEEYGLEDFPLDLIKANEEKASSTIKNGDGYERLLGGVAEGERNVAATKLAGIYFNLGMSKNEVTNILKRWNEKNTPPLEQKELHTIIDNIDKKESEKQQEEPDSFPWRKKPPLPEPIDELAFRGLAGEVVRAWDGYTEAGEEAILAAFLTIFGNAAMAPDQNDETERTPRIKAGAKSHYTNLYTVIVGDTSEARKDEAVACALEFFPKHEVEKYDKRNGTVIDLDDEWHVLYNVASGVTATGEGLLDLLKDIEEDEDEYPKTKNLKKKKRKEGREDKRLLAKESEFTKVIRKGEAQGSILNEILCCLWDDGNYVYHPKTKPAKVTAAHFSVVGTTTQDNLLETLPRYLMLSGYVNRFMWFITTSRGLLPEPKEIPAEVKDKLKYKVKEAIKFAKTIGIMTRSEEARELWKVLYGDGERRGVLNQIKGSGIFKHILHRKAQQCLRLSLIYALLDKSDIIQPDHIRAALAVVDYYENSTLYIFQSVQDDALLNEMINYIEQKGQVDYTSLGKTLRAKKWNAEQIADRLKKLYDYGVIEVVTEKKKTGRPKTLVSLKIQE